MRPAIPPYRCASTCSGLKSREWWSGFPMVVDRRAQFQAESLRRRFQSERTNTTLACADAFTGTLTYLAMLASSIRTDTG
jgi:hypothetical protein